MIDGDIIDRSNDTIDSNQSLNKSLETINGHNVESVIINTLTQSQVKTENNGKNITEDSALNSTIPNIVIPSSQQNSSLGLPEEPLASIVLNNDSSNSEINDKTVSEETPVTNIDDIPTFVEYQQMIEKESKHKREKSDTISSNPSQILKDNHPVKGALDPPLSHVATEHPDSLQPTLSTLQENKDDIDASHTARKLEETKVDITTSVLSKSLMKNNVAAKECGAKILEISGQITNANFVLNNNKDEYLNVPCSIVDKWFIIETCEPVQIRSIQIANFEMFSSRPKTFKVQTADRYPVKHWYNLGLFRAHDEKGIQTFEVTDTRMVKYLKFEMVDHYGSEHYCPLTFVRVMGNVVIDDMDEEHDEDQPVIGETHEPPKEAPSTTTDSNGILTKAKDILVKIVNGIGGSHKEDVLQTNHNDLQPTETSAAKSKHIGNQELKVITPPSEESPCYFFEFVSKNYRNYFQEICLNFRRLAIFKEHIKSDSSTTFETTIRQQPFPMQIRAEYFMLFDFINKTDTNFWRLYLSFSNVSIHLSNVCFEENSLRNLSQSFKCHFYHFPSFGHYQPMLQNITMAPHVQVTSTDNLTPIVLIPNVTTKITESNDTQSDVNQTQYEPAFSGNIDVTSTANHPTTSNDSTLEEDDSSFTKNKDEEEVLIISQDNKINQVAKETKTETTDYAGTETHKTAQTRNKADETFDNKLFASPGSNAWNYAFMRIKNIAKELEVNVSISMKYLEELSQNYKQQTDKLKKAQLVMAANVTKLENMINKHREETKGYINELKVQLQTILLRMKISVKSDMAKKRTSNSMNLSTMDKITDNACMDILTDGLTLPSPSWFESTLFLIVINVSLSLLFNSILLVVFYNKMRTSILYDVRQILSSSSREIISEPIEEIPNFSKQRRSMIELRPQQTSYPVVLPPRGVRLQNFPDSDYLSDNDNLPRRHKGLGPFFYPVQPNVNFVTPTKDKKKKRRK